MKLRLLQPRRERLTAAQATILAKREFGPDYYATARNGRRCILKQVSPLCVSFIATEDTWLEAFAAARTKVR